MSRCWLEGEWRAWLDRELPPAGMEAAERHLEECPRCAALCAELRVRAAGVGVLLGALDYMPQSPRAVPRPAVSWTRRGLAAALVLAAAWAVVLLMLPANREPRPSVPAPERQVAAAPPALPGGSLDQPLPVAARRHPRAGAAKPGRQPQYYIALDDEPIESGVVVRVTLPESGLLADVIYDEQGRPRAVRPLN